MNPAQKRKFDALCKLYKQYNITRTVLSSDAKFADALWQKDYESQFWRRTILRCLCAYIEGTMSLLKTVTPEAANYFGVSLTSKDFEVVTETRKCIENGVATTKKSFLRFPDNLKATLKIYAKAHANRLAIKFDDLGFKDLCATFELRNKLMHPKGVFDLEVSDKALEATDRGIKWFDFAVGEIVDQGAKKFSFSKTS